MNKLNWCLNKKNGLELIEPNLNLSKGYIIKAEESLETSFISKSKDWKISAAYYTIYFSIYSIMMQIGVKSEIHSCTIEFAKAFLNDYFSDKELDIFEKAFEARNDSQYYINREISKDNYDLIINNLQTFLSMSKNLVLSEQKINSIRVKLKNM